MAASDDKSKSPKEEVAQLRDQLEALSDPMEPAAKAAAGVADQAAGVAAQASDYAKQAYAAVDERTEWVKDWTRQSPVVALGLACVVGYVLGRVVR